MTLWLLRAVVTLFLLAVLAQPVLAGLYLSGEFDALAVHGAIATDGAAADTASPMTDGQA